MWILEELILQVLHSKRSDAFKIAALKKLLNRETKLDLRESNLEDSEIILLAKALEQNNTVSSLDLSSNKIGPHHKIGLAAVTALAKTLETNKTLTRLNFRSNNIGPAAAKVLAKALGTNQSLTDLDLSSNDIESEGAQAIAEALKTNKKIIKLDLALNKIDTVGIQAIAEALKINRTLQHLDLGWHEIKLPGIQALAHVLGTNQSSLTSLSLSASYIGGKEGVKTLATALETNTSLTKLDLRSTKVESSGAQALAKALRVNQTLRSLRLEASDIDSVGAIALANSLKINQTLNSLNLERNNIGSNAANAFADTLTINQTLTDLNLDSTSIGLNGVLKLAESLKKNHTLRRLNLGFNNITLEGSKAFEEVLKTNQSLTMLVLHDFDFSTKGNQKPPKMNKIHAYLKRNRALPLPLRKSKQVDESLDSSGLIPPLREIVKEYADLPGTSKVKQKPNKIGAFLKKLASQFQQFFRKIVQFFKRQWTNIKNKIGISQPTPSDANKTSDLKPIQKQPPQNTPLSAKKESTPAATTHVDDPSGSEPESLSTSANQKPRK